jgi:hypothetical protein
MSEDNKEFDFSQIKFGFHPAPVRPDDPLIQINYDRLYGAYALPQSVDFRSKMSSIKDQGRTNSCTSFACTGAVEYLLRQANKLPAGEDSLSEKFLYYCTRVYIQNQYATTDQGASMTAVTDASKRYGICLEKLMPWDGQISTQPSKEATEDAKVRQVVQAARIQDSVSDRQKVLTDMKAVLAQEVPLIIGYEVFSNHSSSSVTQTGVLPPPSYMSVGGHAICLCGYDDIKQHFIFKNSWTPRWGDKGFGYLPYSYIVQRKASDMWSIIAAEAGSDNDIVKVINVGPAPTPTPTPQPQPQPTPQPQPQPQPQPGPLQCTCQVQIPFINKTVPCNCNCCSYAKKGKQASSCKCKVKISFLSLPINCECDCCKRTKSIPVQESGCAKCCFC